MHKQAQKENEEKEEKEGQQDNRDMANAMQRKEFRVEKYRRIAH